MASRPAAVAACAALCQTSVVSDPEPQPRNLAALIGSIFAGVAALVVVATFILSASGTHGVSESTYARIALVAIAAIILPSIVALVLGIIGLRRSRRRGRTGLAVATVAVSSVFLGLFTLWALFLLLEGVLAGEI